MRCGLQRPRTTGAVRGSWPGPRRPGALRALRRGPRRSGRGPDSRGRPSPQLAEQQQPVVELSGREEVRPHVLSALGAHGVGADRVREEVNDPLRAPFDAVDEVAAVVVDDLELDPSGATTDDRPALPEGLTDGEPEPFATRLLHHNVGDQLERE